MQPRDIRNLIIYMDVSFIVLYPPGVKRIPSGNETLAVDPLVDGVVLCSSAHAVVRLA